MSTKSKGTPITDPLAEQEAARYEHPVPSRVAVLECLKQAGEPLSFEELAARLGVADERDQANFSRRLRAMERDGQLHRNRRGRYGLVDKLDMVCGTVHGHPEGYGFLLPEEGGEDLFLSPKEMRKAMHGDRVMGRVTGVDRRGRREGMIVQVLEHRHTHIVGRFFSEHGMAFVVPDDRRISQDLLIPPGEEGGARPGQIVVAQIIEYPTQRTQPVARITEVLGDHMAPGMEVELAIRKYELPHQWPDEVLAEARELGDTVPEAAKRDRVDLRQLPLVTIDGADARDFDDAVYCRREGRGWRLMVAIADVSHYVKPDSALDKEAYRRGTSVYFPNRVIPMLPEELSNGLCSLNPKVDRLCMVCEMQIGPRGKIESHRFYEGVMRSHARLTYTEVAAMLVEQDAGLRQRYAAVLPHLEELYRLYKVLHGLRRQRGAVDFDMPETRIVFDDHGKIERIVPVVRNDAHRLIEECMLAANVSAAEFLKTHEVPTPYRIHAGPTQEKLEGLREFLAELGLKLGGGDKPQAKDYAALLDSVAERPDAGMIQAVMLRSLSQAVYSPDNVGHFALAYPSYAHFTSPIRRYPDLMVHRAIKRLLKSPRAATKARARGRAKAEQMELLDPLGQMKKQSEHCSMAERRADEATWDVIRWLKTEYMQDKVGEDFDGVVSGVTNFGLFVELADIFVDGLVHITALGNDYYHFDAAKHRLTGERTGQSFRLGDRVRVKVVRVDLDEGRIDFELVGKEAAPAGAAAGRKTRKRGGRKKTQQKKVPAKTRRKVKRGKTATRKTKARKGSSRRGGRR